MLVKYHLKNPLGNESIMGALAHTSIQMIDTKIESLQELNFRPSLHLIAIK